jgi:hypothetical protein
MALFGHAAISELSLLSGVKRKLDFEPAKGSFWGPRKAAIELYSKRICLALVRWSYPKLAHEGPDRKGNPLGK